MKKFIIVALLPLCVLCTDKILVGSSAISLIEKRPKVKMVGSQLNFTNFSSGTNPSTPSSKSSNNSNLNAILSTSSKDEENRTASKVNNESLINSKTVATTILQISSTNEPQLNNSKLSSSTEASVSKILIASNITVFLRESTTKEDIAITGTESSVINDRKPMPSYNVTQRDKNNFNKFITLSTNYDDVQMNGTESTLISNALDLLTSGSSTLNVTFDSSTLDNNYSNSTSEEPITVSIFSTHIAPNSTMLHTTSLTSTTDSPYYECHTSCKNNLSRATFSANEGVLVAGSNLTLLCQLYLSSEMSLKNMFMLFQNNSGNKLQCSLTREHGFPLCDGYEFVEETVVNNGTNYKKILKVGTKSAANTGTYTCQIIVICCPDSHPQEMSHELRLSLQIWEEKNYSFDLLIAILLASLFFLMTFLLVFYFQRRQKRDDYLRIDNRDGNNWELGTILRDSSPGDDLSDDDSFA